MKPPYLHVGFPKTGTTWLQHEVFPAHPQLQLFSIKSPNSKWVTQIVDQHDFAFQADFFQGCYQQFTDASDPRQVVISQENMVGSPFTGGRGTLITARRLKAIFPDARIIICLREQRSMINSLYRQYIQAGGAMSIKRFLTLRAPTAVHFAWEYLRYDAVLDHYSELFGRESIHICLFEELQGNPQGFLDSLFDFIGVDRLPVPPASARNVGVSTPSLLLMRLLNRFVRSNYNVAPLVPTFLLNSQSIRYMTQKILDPWIFNRFAWARKKDLIPPEFTDSLRDFYHPVNRSLVEKYGLPLEKYGYMV
jgi:hypothetical protein